MSTTLTSVEMDETSKGLLVATIVSVDIIGSTSRLVSSLTHLANSNKAELSRLELSQIFHNIEQAMKVIGEVDLALRSMQ